TAWQVWSASHRMQFDSRSLHSGGMSFGFQMLLNCSMQRSTGGEPDAAAHQESERVRVKGGRTGFFFVFGAPASFTRKAASTTVSSVSVSVSVSLPPADLIS